MLQHKALYMYAPYYVYLSDILRVFLVVACAAVGSLLTRSLVLKYLTYVYLSDILRVFLVVACAAAGSLLTRSLVLKYLTFWVLKYLGPCIIFARVESAHIFDAAK